MITTSLHLSKRSSENPYHDRLEGDVLVYTGAGKEGDQSLSGVNKRIPDQVDCAFPIYGFRQVGSRRDKSIGPKRWEFMGLLEYLMHYPETQVDVRGSIRKVWVFEFLVRTDVDQIEIENDVAMFAEILANGNRPKILSMEDRSVMRSPAELSPVEIDPLMIESIRKKMLALPPEQFEHLVRKVLENSGFNNVCVTKFSQDGGIDVVASVGDNLWPIADLSIQIQAKRWRHTVGRKEVAELRGSMGQFSKGAIVTTSHYSKAALTESKAPGKNPINLIDGFQFACLVNRLFPSFAGT